MSCADDTAGFPGSRRARRVYIYGGAASQNPAFCYRMWSEGGFPSILENTTRCEIEEAFGLGQWESYEDLSESAEDEDEEVLRFRRRRRGRWELL